MFKKVIQGVVVGTAMFGLVGAAQAAEININLYGASAQFLFWNDMADDFLISKGCSDVVQDQQSANQGITKGTCGGDIVYFRYSSKASFDGIYAVKGAADTDSCGNAFQRKMVDETTCPWDGPGGDNCTGLKCVEVILGASDVAGSAFTQKSKGQLRGPDGGGEITRTFDKVDDSGLDSYQPNVVPFGFFAHKTVTKAKCLGPDPKFPTAGAVKAVSTWGYQCYDSDNDGKSADCIGYYQCVGGSCSGGVNVGNPCTRANQCPDVTLADTRCERIPLDNISRLQAVMIFSGQAWYWTDFGAWYNSDPIVACLRHAGSGTAAALDWTIMRSSAKDWGWPLVEEQNAVDPTVWFNDSSSHMMNCVNTQAGAVGYADADQLEGNANYQNVVALRYNGVEPRRTKIRNGEYDFYTNQWIYGNPSRPAYNNIKTSWVQPLMAFAADPANIPGNKAKFWATQDEMYFNRGTDDAYPGYTGASDPQLP